MLVRHAQRDLVWVDLTAPTPAEVKGLMQEFGLDPLIAEELLVPSFKPSALRRGDALYVVLHFPAGGHGTYREQELDFVVGKKFLITAHYEHIDPLHAFSKVLEVSTVLGTEHAAHGGHLFAVLVRELYRATLRELDAIRRHLDSIEEHIFSGEERRMVMQLGHAGRAIHDTKQALIPHGEMLNSLEGAAARIFEPGFSWWLRDVIGAYDRTLHTLGHLHDSLRELRDTNDSLLSTKQNEIMQTLTMMAFVTFPLTLIAALFSMDTHATPIVGMPGDFWIVLGMMLVLVVSFLLYFKHRHWL